MNIPHSIKPALALAALETIVLPGHDQRSEPVSHELTRWSSTGDVDSAVPLQEQGGDTRWSSQVDATTPPLQMLERGPGGEGNPPPRPLSFPHSPLICPHLTGIGSCKSILEHRAPPGRDAHEVSSCQLTTVATPPSRGHRVMTDPAPRHSMRWRSMTVLRATPRAPGADVPPATTAGAPGQYRLRAAPRAPGHGRPLAITAEAPCHDRLSAVPAAPDHDRSDARHTMAPGHGRPLAALSAARHDRPRATPRAPGTDVPPATTAEAPGQYRLSAAHRASDHFRSRPAPRAPGHEPTPRRLLRRGVAWPSACRHEGTGCWRTPGHYGRGAGSVPSACRGVSPPSPCRPANTGCARRACPASLPIPAP